MTDAGLDGVRSEMRALGPVTPRETAWALVGDTDWLNRVAGNGAVLDMSMRAQRDGLPVIEGHLAGPAGLTFPFEEAWTGWSRGAWFRQVRSVRSALLKGTDYEARLVPEGDGVRAELRLALYTPAWGLPAAKLTLAKVKARWEAALAAAGAESDVRTLPREAREALGRWAPSDPEVVDRVERWLRSARPTALGRIRAFALADGWGMDRERVLGAMIAGVSAGAVELFWSVRCVRCYGQVAAATALSDLPDHVDCPSCHLRTDADLADSVEVLFAPHPSVVPRSDERFCTMYPAAAPEQYAIYTLAPGESLAEEIDLPTGSWRLGAAGNAADELLDATPGGPTTIPWTSTGPAWAPDQAPLRVGAGRVRLELQNPGDRRVRVYLTRMGGEDPVVTAALITTRPAWSRAFSHQVLSPDLRVSVRSVCLLFTDLSGSTAMYEELGDARAFAVVRDHFTILRAAIEGAGGVVVKTIGDAVMAAFHEPERGVAAALEMQRAFTPWAEGLGLGRPLTLKVGLHHGPALAVHAPQGGLDWFGGAVNLAARTQGAAHGGETLITEALWSLAAVQRVAAEARLDVEPVDVELKGFAGVTRLWRLVPGA